MRFHLRAPIFRGHLVNMPHHVSIINDDKDRFRIVYVRVVNQVPLYHLYDSAVGVWVVRESDLAGMSCWGLWVSWLLMIILLYAFLSSTRCCQPEFGLHHRANLGP
ncbi:hypothetical protein CTI12_AA092880 [Artemisia annua]|uniref:Uncharacterized protein n=1 Tax=Artemisia annua TaxID=35608 RepID=A0A2U1PZQ0_ARTAN|nr:hypothetical protein CTI12_AA092880 [Artemisia annua]